MEIITKLKETWLSRKMPKNNFITTLLIMSTFVFGSVIYLNNFFNANKWMAVSFELAINQQQYWRLLTSLFAHGDFAHIGNNMLFFFPFCYYLMGYFGILLFPFLGFVFGGIINLIVIHGMPEHTTLIGASGMVHWMGGIWLTLAFFIDQKPSVIQRILKFSAISILLFLPDTLKPDVSYMSHFVGYILGILAGSIYYLLQRNKFNNAKVYEYVIEDDALVGFDYSETTTSSVANE
jgi:rhomboid protease GluP